MKSTARYYRTQTPDTYRKWAGETPDGFVFSLKAPRYAPGKRVLAEAGPSIERFFESGVHELGEKLGPILWQFAPTKKFEPDDFAGFLALLPAEVHGLPLRHALEVRHASFDCPRFLELAEKARAAIVLADLAAYPRIDADTGGFRYARLMKSRAEEPLAIAPGNSRTGPGARAAGLPAAGTHSSISSTAPRSGLQPRRRLSWPWPEKGEPVRRERRREGKRTEKRTANNS